MADCYASFRVSAACAVEDCTHQGWKPTAITHAVDGVFYCPEHCPVCTQEGERRRGAKKGGAE